MPPVLAPAPPAPAPRARGAATRVAESPIPAAPGDADPSRDRVPALLRELPYPVSAYRPPYDRGEILLPGAARPYVPGTIFVLGIPRLPGEPDAMHDLLPRLRAAFPCGPFVARVPPELGREALHFACRAGRMNLRAVMVEGEPLAETLRPILTDWGGLCEGVVEWLAIRGVVLSPALGWLVQNVFRLAPAERTLAAVLKRLGQPETSTRFRLRKKRLPPPQQWHHLARALHTALRIQAHPQAELLGVALDDGYGSHAAMSRQFKRLFGVAPAAIRGTLGWEWLLDGWFRRHVAPRRAAGV